jgi:hypothetical protein
MSVTRHFFIGGDLKGPLGTLRMKEMERITRNNFHSKLIADRFTFPGLGKVIGAGTR